MYSFVPCQLYIGVNIHCFAQCIELGLNWFFHAEFDLGYELNASFCKLSLSAKAWNVAPPFWGQFGRSMGFLSLVDLPMSHSVCVCVTVT